MSTARSNRKPPDAQALAQALADLQEHLRAYCEAEQLLAETYKAVWEYFFGEEAFPDHSLNDWLRDIEFREDVLRDSLAFCLIAKVTAHLVATQDALNREKAASGQRLLSKARACLDELETSLPAIYLDSRVNAPAPQKGGYVKDILHKCSLMLHYLEENHRLDGDDFKSFDEAVNYAVKAVIAVENIKDDAAIKDLRRFYPYIFRRSLADPDNWRRFKECTGISLSEQEINAISSPLC